MVVVVPEEKCRLPTSFDCDGPKDFHCRHGMVQEKEDFGGLDCLDRTCTWEKAALHLMDPKDEAAETRVEIVRKLLLLWAVVPIAAVVAAADIGRGFGVVHHDHWNVQASSSDCLRGATKRDNPSFIQLPLRPILFPSVLLCF